MKCEVENCTKKTRSPQCPYCEMHYYRLRRNGSLELKPKCIPERRSHSHGYVLLYSPGHPLAVGCTVFEHRAVFFAANGEGPFHCHWCDVLITWTDMHVDHVNDVRNDNRLENLVASCAVCNQARGHHKIQSTMIERYGRKFEFRGEALTAGQWAKKLGLSKTGFNHRINNGWPMERIVTEAKHPTGPKRVRNTGT